MLTVCEDWVTRCVPSIATRFSPMTRAIPSCSGDAHRLNSSGTRRFGPMVTTIWGRSTTAGTDTGPTATDTSETWAADGATGLNTQKREGREAAQAPGEQTTA